MVQATNCQMPKIQAEYITSKVAFCVSLYRCVANIKSYFRKTKKTKPTAVELFFGHNCIFSSPFMRTCWKRIGLWLNSNIVRWRQRTDVSEAYLLSLTSPPRFSQQKPHNNRSGSKHNTQKAKPPKRNTSQKWRNNGVFNATIWVGVQEDNAVHLVLKRNRNLYPGTNGYQK